MKIVILGNTQVPGYNHGVYSWFVKTFWQGLVLNGHEVVLINYKTNNIEQMRSKILFHKPSYVFTHLTFHGFHPTNQVLNMFSDVSKQAGVKFIHTCHDARDQDRYMGDVSNAIHAAFVGTYSMKRACEPVWKVPVHYLPYSSLTYDKMASPVKNLSFQNPVFTGGPNTHQDRADFIRRLQQHIKIEIFQTQSSRDLRNVTPQLSVSAKCILGLSTKYDVDGYIDVRPFQYGGTGACMIMRKFNTEFIPDDLYYPITSYEDDGIQQTLEHWKTIQKTDTMDMRIRMFNYMQEHHNSKVRMKQAMEKLK